mmetsp:Transcript_27186/g.65054  ORF Transcript_27186/g.65054 Transcript_27186/m.65054 type:complete len:341 (+) Transcript_27186:149-1171(+)
MISSVLVVAEAAAAVADTTTAAGQLLIPLHHRVHGADVVREIFCAALAAVFTVTWLHPIDVVKTRIQVSTTTTTRNKKNNGTLADNTKKINVRPSWTSYYRGITVAWIAEAVYYGLQLGLYEPLKTYLSSGKNFNNNNDDDIGVESVASVLLRTKILAGALAGLFGAVIGNPFVILRTRMVANDGERRNIVSFVKDVIRDDGLVGFYKGFTAMFLRAMVLSATKMVTYDTCKTMVQDKLLLEGVPLQFMSAFIAGLFITATVMPFDMIRTRMMLPSTSHNNNVGDNKKHTSFVQCANDIYDEFGIRGFYRGSVAFCVRIAPKTCLQFIVFEYLKQKQRLF